MILGTMTEQEKMKSSLGITVQTYIYVLLFIGIILILYTMSHYSRVRFRDYGMFMVLGSEKRYIIWMIMVEYGMICLISYVIGCVMGTVFLLLVKKILQFKDISVVLNHQMFIELIFTTLLYVLAIFMVAVLLNLVSLQRHSLSALLKYREKKSKVPSLGISMIGAGLGILCMIITFLLIGWKPLTYKKMKYGIILALCGVYLCFTYLGGVVLYLLKKREKWYNNHLLSIKNLYYRFSENKNIILLAFVLDLFVLVFINTNVVEYGNTSSNHLWKYPFDYVWMIEEEHVEDIRQGVGDFEKGMAVYPYVSLSDTEGGEYIGIPVSAYNRLAKKEAHLNSGEILAIMQKAEDDTEVMFQSDQVHLWHGERTGAFHIKAETKEILLIAQQSELIRILVMNDEDYSSMKMPWSKDMVIVTQNMPEQEEAVGEAMEDQLSVIAKSCDAKIFSKETLLLRDGLEDMMTLIFYICMGTFLIISNMTILAVKVWSEAPLLSSKYGFLEKLGMDAVRAENHIKSELSIYLKIPFLLSMIFGIMILLYLLRDVEMVLVLQVIKLFAVLAVLQTLYIIGIRNYGYRLIIDRMDGENGGRYGHN